jgi:hypothetical protein
VPRAAVRRRHRACTGRDRRGRAARATVERTADALCAEGFDEDAFALLVERGLYERAADLLVAIAERYARRGQAQLLLRATSRLPAALADARPWLCFWSVEWDFSVYRTPGRKRFRIVLA